MPLIWENDNMWIAKNEIFYTTANAAQMRKKTFLKNINYMGSYWLNDNDKKQLRSLLISFSLEQFHSWMEVNDYILSCQNEVIFIHLLIMDHLEVSHMMWRELGANRTIC